MRLLLIVSLLLSAPKRGPKAGPDTEAEVPAQSSGEKTSLVEELPMDMLTVKDDPRKRFPLSMADAVVLTVGQNPALIGAKQDLLVANARILRERDPFVPTLQTDIGISRAWNTADFTSPGASFIPLSGGLTVTENLPTGTSLSLGLRAAMNTNTAALSTFSTDHQATLRLQVTQSLLRRIGLAVDLAAINSAKMASSAAQNRLNFVVEQLVQRVGISYYALFEQVETYRARRQGRKYAIELYELTKKRIANGSAAPYEIHQARSTLAARYSLELTVEQAQDFAHEAMLLLFNARIRNDGALDGLTLLTPTTDPTPVHTAESVDQLIGRAMRSREDLLASQWDIDAGEVERYAAERKFMPELALSAYVEQLGAAGFLSPASVVSITQQGGTFDPRRVGDLGKAFGNLVNPSFTNWGAVLTLEVPLYFGSQRAAIVETRSVVERARANRIQIEQQIRTDVTLAVAQQARAIKRLNVAKISLEAAEQNLSAEGKKMKAGSSTNFDVLRIQDEVVNALAAIAAAKAELGRAVTNLRFALGEGRQGLALNLQPIFTGDELNKRSVPDHSPGGYR